MDSKLLSQKLIEISEMFGDRYGQYEYKLAWNIHQAALSFRFSAGTSFNLVRDIDARLKDLTLDDVQSTYLNYLRSSNQRKAERYKTNFEKLEQDIVPQVLALARTYHLWEEHDSHFYEEFPEYLERKQEIIDELAEIEEEIFSRAHGSLWKMITQSEEVNASLKRDIERAMSEGSAENLDLKEYEDVYEELLHSTRQDFVNLQEWEIADVLVEAILSLKNEVEQLKDRIISLEEDEGDEAASKFRTMLSRKLEKLSVLEKTSTEVLAVYRLVSRCLYLTFKQTNSEEAPQDEISDLFQELSLYLTAAWEPIMRKAKLQAQALTEFNELMTQDLLDQI